MFFLQTHFSGNDFATIKKFRQNIYLKHFCLPTCFRGIDFATIKNFLPKKVPQIFSANVFLEECFCNHKQISTKDFSQNFLSSNMFSREGFCNYKTFSPKTNFLKMLFVKSYFWGNDFES
jgi:hypothetical protein